MPLDAENNPTGDEISKTRQVRMRNAGRMNESTLSENGATHRAVDMAITTRRAVRAFLATPVSLAMIREFLEVATHVDEAAMHAQLGRNRAFE